ncbi:hypothetical protein JNJ66_02125 [Candidatus Saccharibacteria bacterium]|nr:hypothetical protein [Candidatus Saccharibacteria bacterium]
MAYIYENAYKKKTRPGGQVIFLVDLRRAFAHPSWETRRLLAMTEGWPDADAMPVPTQVTVPTSRQPASLEERLGPAGVEGLITAFRGGTTKLELAERYGTSVSSVSRLLRKRGVRLYVMERKWRKMRLRRGLR